ncbi:MAG: hypothetical protein ABJN40_06010 [Sneathiella sp.]
MARNRQLIQLIDELRAEAGQAVSSSVGVDKIPALKQIIRRTQETLYDDFDWPHLRIQPVKQLSAGQRYYDLPANMDYERIEEVVVWYSGHPHPLVREITFSDYSQYDSEEGERSEPALKWDIRDTGAGEQIEIWPVPSSNSSKLQFKGLRRLGGLIDDSDTADLDNHLIVLFAAAEILSRQKSPDAQAKLAAANSRYAKLKGRAKGASRTVVMGGGHRSNAYQHGRPIIRVG